MTNEVALGIVKRLLILHVIYSDTLMQLQEYSPLSDLLIFGSRTLMDSELSHSFSLQQINNNTLRDILLFFM